MTESNGVGNGISHVLSFQSALNESSAVVYFYMTPIITLIDSNKFKKQVFCYGILKLYL